MKLSEYKNEAALDLLVDIAEPAAEIFADKEISEALKRGDKKIAVVKNAIKNHKKSVIEILAVLDGIPVEEYSCNVFTIPVKLLEILNDKDLIEFFTSAGQTKGAKSSTSHTENIEEKEQ